MNLFGGSLRRVMVKCLFNGRLKALENRIAWGRNLMVHDGTSWISIRQAPHAPGRRWPD